MYEQICTIQICSFSVSYFNFHTDEIRQINRLQCSLQSILLFPRRSRLQVRATYWQAAEWTEPGRGAFLWPLSLQNQTLSRARQTVVVTRPLSTAVACFKERPQRQWAEEGATALILTMLLLLGKYKQMPFGYHGVFTHFMHGWIFVSCARLVNSHYWDNESFVCWASWLRTV